MEQEEAPGHGPQTVEGQTEVREATEKGWTQGSPCCPQILTHGPQSAAALSVPAEVSSP